MNNLSQNVRTQLMDEYLKDPNSDENKDGSSITEMDIVMKVGVVICSSYGIKENMIYDKNGVLNSKKKLLRKKDWETLLHEKMTQEHIDNLKNDYIKKNHRDWDQGSSSETNKESLDKRGSDWNGNILDKDDNDNITNLVDKTGLKLCDDNDPTSSEKWLCDVKTGERKKKIDDVKEIQYYDDYDFILHEKPDGLSSYSGENMENIYFNVSCGHGLMHDFV